MFELFKNDDECNFFHNIILEAKDIVNGDELVKMLNGVLESEMIGQVLYDHALDLGFDIDRDFFVTHSAAILAAMQNAGCLPAYITLIRYLLGEDTEIIFEQPAEGHLIVNIKEKVISEDGLGGMTIGGKGELVTTSLAPPPVYDWVVNYEAGRNWAKFPPVAIPSRGVPEGDSAKRFKPVGLSAFEIPVWTLQATDEISFFVKPFDSQDGAWHYFIDEPASGGGTSERPYIAIDSAGKLAFNDNFFDIYINNYKTTNADQFTIWDEVYHIRAIAKTAAAGKQIANIRKSRDSAELFNGELYSLALARRDTPSVGRFYPCMSDGAAPADPTVISDIRGGLNGTLTHGAWGEALKAGKMKFKFNSSNNLASDPELAFYLTSFVKSNHQIVDGFYSNGSATGNSQSGLYLDSRGDDRPVGSARFGFDQDTLSSLKLNGVELVGMLWNDPARFVTDDAIYQIELEAGTKDLICRDMGIGHYNGNVGLEGFTGEIYDVEFESPFDDGHGQSVKFTDKISSDAEPQTRKLEVNGLQRSDMFYNNDARQGALTGWYKRAATWTGTDPSWRGVKVTGNNVPWFGVCRPMWEGLHAGSLLRISVDKCTGTLADGAVTPFTLIIRGSQTGKNYLTSYDLVEGFTGDLEFNFNGLSIDEPCVLMVERAHSNPPDGEIIIASMTMNGETFGSLDGLGVPWKKSKVQNDSAREYTADSLEDKGVLLQKVQSDRTLIETKKILEMIKPKGIFTEFNFVK